MSSWRQAGDGLKADLPVSIRDLLTAPLQRSEGGLLVFAHASAQLEALREDDFEDKTATEAFVNKVHLDFYGDEFPAVHYAVQLFEAVDLVVEGIARAVKTGSYRIVGNVNVDASISATIRFHQAREDEGDWIDGVEGFSEGEGVLIEAIEVLPPTK